MILNGLGDMGTFVQAQRVLAIEEIQSFVKNAKGHSVTRLKLWDQNLKF